MGIRECPNKRHEDKNHNLKIKMTKNVITEKSGKNSRNHYNIFT